jgi:nicotinamidase-related amidase
MLLDAEQSQLVLIDLQARLLPAIEQGEDCLANSLRLAQAAQLFEVPIWGTEQNPAKLGSNDPALKALCRQTLAKLQFSACEEGLTQWLRPDVPTKPPAGNARSLPKHLQKTPAASTPERNSVVLAGVEAHVCVLQTALDLLEDEFEVWVVTDACSSRTERNRDAAFDRLAGAGIELVTTEMVLFEWLRTAEHPLFKDIQGLIK